MYAGYRAFAYKTENKIYFTFLLTRSIYEKNASGRDAYRVDVGRLTVGELKGARVK